MKLEEQVKRMESRLANLEKQTSFSIADLRLYAVRDTPSTPLTGWVRFYVKQSDGKLYRLNDDGVETAVG